MPKYLVNVDLNQNQLVKARVENLSSAPGSPVEGQIYFNTTDNNLYVRAGSAWVDLTAAGTVTSVTGTSPIVSSGGATPAISISASSGSAAGSMSSAHYTLVNAATNANTASTIVKRDGSGNFTAGTITAALTGNASSATNAGHLETSDGSGTYEEGDYYLARANHTGSQAASTISDFDTEVRTSRLDQMAAPTGSVSANSQKITSLADPTADTDAANKRYVDAARSGLDVKASVVVASTANLSASYSNGSSGVGATLTNSGSQAALTLDGVSVSADDRVLIKDQSSGAHNGIYTVTTVGNGSTNWVLTRTTDANGSANGVLSGGSFVFVEQGTAGADRGFVITTNGTATIGTTAITWTQFSEAGEMTAGSGLTKTGTTFAVGAGTGITVNANDVQISASYTGQSSITTLGTIATGTWEATDIGVAYGGTGVSTFTSKGILYGNGASAVQVTAAGSQYEVLQAGSGGTPEFGALALAQSDAVTGQLAIANGGTGASTAAAARTALSATTKVTGTIGDGSATSIAVTHSLGTDDVVVEVYDASSKETVVCDVDRTSTNEVTITFASAPSSNAYKVVVIG